MEVEELGDSKGTLRQILVVTDGCSNVGEAPVIAAARARQRGVVVNVIGIVDKGDIGRQGKAEAMSIADAGGGMCRLVQPVELSATVQMMTHQAMQLTLQQVVNQELLQVMGKSTEDLPPADRTRVMQVVDKLEEETDLEVVVTVDTSASMREKIPTVREAIRDLSLSLQARQGRSSVAVVSFPGRRDALAETVQPFQTEVDMDLLEGILAARGGTPTGPAIDHALSLFGASPRDEEDGPRRWADGANV